MGRIRNAKLDQQQELEEQLADLRQQLADKETEFLNFEIRDHVDSLQDMLRMLTRRIEILETNAERQAIKIADTTNGRKNNITNSRIFSLITIITTISAIYYKLRH